MKINFNINYKINLQLKKEIFLIFFFLAFFYIFVMFVMNIFETKCNYLFQKKKKGTKSQTTRNMFTLYIPFFLINIFFFIYILYIYLF